MYSLLSPGRVFSVGFNHLSEIFGNTWLWYHLQQSFETSHSHNKWYLSSQGAAGCAWWVLRKQKVELLPQFSSKPSLHTHADQLYGTHSLDQSMKRLRVPWCCHCPHHTPGTHCLVGIAELCQGQKSQGTALHWPQGTVACMMAPQPEIKFRLIHTHTSRFFTMNGIKYPYICLPRFFPDLVHVWFLQTHRHYFCEWAYWPQH